MSTGFCDPEPAEGGPTGREKSSSAEAVSPDLPPPLSSGSGRLDRPVHGRTRPARRKGSPHRRRSTYAPTLPASTPLPWTGRSSRPEPRLGWGLQRLAGRPLHTPTPSHLPLTPAYAGVHPSAWKGVGARGRRVRPARAPVWSARVGCAGGRVCKPSAWTPASAGVSGLGERVFSPHRSLRSPVRRTEPAHPPARQRCPFRTRGKGSRRELPMSPFGVVPSGQARRPRSSRFAPCGGTADHRSASRGARVSGQSPSS